MKTKTVQALEIVHKNRINSGRQFAEFLWPNSEGWTNRINSGRGVVAGRGMSLAGGSFLGKLSKKGLIRYSRAEGRYLVTEDGLAVIDAAQDRSQLTFLSDLKKEAQDDGTA